MTATLQLELDAVLRLRWNGDVPSVALDKAVRAVPGAREIQGGYEWGWWRETAERLALLPGVAAAARRPEGWPEPVADPLGENGWTWVSPDRVEAVEWRSPTEPRPHQLAFKAWRRGGGRDGLWHPACLLEAGLGTGKTLSAIEEMLELLVHRARARILALCRASLIETVWGRQLEEHAAGLPFELLNIPRSRKLLCLQLIARRSMAGAGPLVVVHSHEDMPAMGKALADVEWDMIVVDEIARFRTASTKRTGRLTGFQARPLTAPYRLALSGLPMIKSPYDLYPMLRWLGAPTGNKMQFSGRFMATKPFTREEILIDEPGLRSLLDCWRFQVPKNTVLDIPRSWRYERVLLKAWQRAAYRKVQKDLADRDATELAGARLEELLRLAQVTAGFEATPPRPYRRDNAKLEHLLQRVLPELPDDDQIVIWTRFKEEAVGVAYALNTANVRAGAYTGALSKSENAEALRDFERGYDRVLVSTLGKGGIGLNLPQARTMIYLTRDFDTEAYLQSLERNIRLTTTHADTRVIVIEAEYTIDQKITQVLGDDAHAASRLTTLDVREVLGW